MIFKLRPGITGLASLEYRNEVELLKKAKDPEAYFINSIIPDKLRFNKLYLKKRNFLFDLKLIFITIYRVVAK
ncbi:sugar transferase [Jejuia pallidilutea]|uniref:Glycosyltransferase n=1 Tax=Jejuia pallidilutea TaxID=504487 RepID=A0A090W3G9_9FLAO|nr:sugar transferase [Jejuia pallidilutea]GAL70788.1 glycosyltransferase [Jejuia pallidilutea]